MDRAYVTFEPRDPDRDPAVLEAVSWALERCSREHPEVTLWMPDRDELNELPQTRRLVRGGLTVCSDRPGRRGHRPLPHTEPVVAFCQGIERLVQLEPALHPVVLVGAFIEDFVPGIPKFGDAFHPPWIDAFDPAHLGGPMIASKAPLERSPVVAAAMRTFTSTTYDGTTMYRTDDGGRVTHGLMLLHDAGYELAPNQMFAAALRAGWRGSEAQRLLQVCREVVAGVRKRPTSRYRPDILASWEQEAAITS